MNGWIKAAFSPVRWQTPIDKAPCPPSLCKLYICRHKVCSCCISSVLSGLTDADPRYSRSLSGQRSPLCSGCGDVVRTQRIFVSCPAPWERPLSHDKQDFLLFQPLFVPYPSSLRRPFVRQALRCCVNSAAGSDRFDGGRVPRCDWQVCRCFHLSRHEKHMGN